MVIEQYSSEEITELAKAMLQVQHQLMVSGAEQAHLWVFDGAKGMLTAMTRDEALMARIREAWEAFQPFLDRDVPPPLSEGEELQQGLDFNLHGSIYTDSPLTAVTAELAAALAELEPCFVAAA